MPWAGNADPGRNYPVSGFVGVKVGNEGREVGWCAVYRGVGIASARLDVGMWGFPAAVNRNHEDRFSAVLRRDGGGVDQSWGAHWHLVWFRSMSVWRHLLEPFNVDAVGEFHHPGGAVGIERVMLAQPQSVRVDFDQVFDFPWRCAHFPRKCHVGAHGHEFPPGFLPERNVPDNDPQRGEPPLVECLAEARAVKGGRSQPSGSTNWGEAVVFVNAAQAVAVAVRRLWARYLARKRSERSVTSYAALPFPTASAPGASAFVPQLRPFATALAADPSQSCTTATLCSVRSPNV